MVKSRNRKKCNRRKVAKVHVKLVPPDWNMEVGNIFCSVLRKRNDNWDLIENAFTSKQRLCCSILTKANADALLLASKDVPQLNVFVTNFFDYISNVSKRWDTFAIGKSFNKTIPRMIDQPLNIQIRKSITYCQLRAFLKDVMAFLFTDSLLGEYNTRLFINKLTSSLFNARVDERLFIQSNILRSICISKVPWFSNLSYEASQILLKCVLTFLCDFFLQVVLKSTFTIYDASENIRFYRSEVWAKVYNDSGDKLLKIREAERLTSFPQDYYYRLWFIPKTDSLRPIEKITNALGIRHSPENLPAQEYLRIINRILVASTESNLFVFGIPKFKQFAHKLRMFAYRNKDVKEFYCFSGDLSGCFTSMNHEFLKKALDDVIPNGEPFVYAEFLICCKGKTFKRWAIGKSATEAREKLVNRFDGCLVSSKAQNEKCVTKSQMITAIKKYSIDTIFKWKGQPFLCHRGIPQGGTLSATLCKIYLSQMEKELFVNSNDFNMDDLMGKKAVVARFVDDYILISNDKTIAEEFITKLANDSKDFDMKMNESKMVLTSNLTHLKKFCPSLSKCRVLDPAERVNWCGFAINTQSLTVMPDPSRLLRTRTIPAYVLKRYGNQDTKQQECCRWLSRRLRLSLRLKFYCMRLCYRNNLRKAKRISMKTTLSSSVNKFYLHYFRRRLYIKQTCKHFKNVIKASRSFIDTAFKRRSMKFKNRIG